MTRALPGHGNTAHSAAQPLRLWFGLSVAITQASMDKIHEKCKKRIKCNETGQVWESVMECAKFFNVKSKQISRVLKGQRKRLKWHFTFSYLPQF